MPCPSQSGSLKVEARHVRRRYCPRIYGSQVNGTAKLQRWQEATRDRQVAKLEELEQTDEEYWECQGL
ncbi:hypothetical protein B0H14DRAFT_3701640 [Mycena olivaceomarginata]|nr:hypothetical protein B0H14DRAFT_3701640 [Mycena olivaceomarginata]